ncbi:DUF4097 family beta strand repeat-containing protein [Xylocopilactobacillus apicola]|uniref:Adhesin domain-containing protein n=1 Tax=Xylocopilactobacillus apicola TaxID=2932184 RepID=A0AAU9DRY7_9LACO|nr:DUF4097 family beta strand repeat-containing protein [Xylocopilactobacillus apicola]BDR57953.1 hypothetical protein XA3_03940 [Xylocopilactobacillus apicola]
MDERKRIMELVKKGVITSEEAIVLLEKLGQKSAEGTSEDTSDHDKKRTAFQEDESSDYVDKLKKRIEQVKERLTVLNTLDDFERLSDEEADEREDLQRSLTELENELESVELQRKRRDSSNNIFGIDFDFDTEGLEEQARSFAAKVKDSVKSFSDNFELRDFNVKVPGFARSKKIINTYEYSADDLKVLNIKNYNGNIVIRKSVDSRIHERITYRVYGNVRNSSAEDFFKNNTVNELSGNTLNLKMHPRIESLIEFSFPAGFDLTSARIHSKNGSFEFNNLKVDDLSVSSTNGSVELKDLTIDHLEINNVNGSIRIEDSILSSGTINTVNGSIKSLQSINNVELSSVNGNIILSNISKDSGDAEAHVVNGNIKMSLPPELGFLIKAESKNGSINNRLASATVNSVDKHHKSMELENVGAGNAKFQVSTISGSVYLKDISPEEGQ